MKLSVLQNKIEKLGLSKKSSAYMIISVLLNGDRIIKPFHLYGNGKQTFTIDYTSVVKEILDSLNLKYEFKNNTKRVSGNLFIVTTHIENN